MAAGIIDDAMLEAMRTKAGTKLRIDHSVNYDVASRLAVLKFVGGIGDVNPLWLDPQHAIRSPYGGPVAPPSFILGCFSGIQFGWPGLGAFHSMSKLMFHKPIYWNDNISASCTYAGFDGPSPSSFAGRTVTDRFLNTYQNQSGDLIAEVEWRVINFERSEARTRNRTSSEASGLVLPHKWSQSELEAIERRILAERPRGNVARYWETTQIGDQLPPLVKGPIGLTDEIAFVAGGGAPIPRLKAHAAALHDYLAHPAWAFRDPTTSAKEPIYAVHYNLHAARAMGVISQYDVGFQRQCWQIHHLTHWCGDDGWVKQCQAEYRRFVYLSDVVELGGEVVDKRVDEDGEHVVDIKTTATNQRNEIVMPGSATIALPSAHSSGSPVATRCRRAQA